MRLIRTQEQVLKEFLALQEPLDELDTRPHEQMKLIAHALDCFGGDGQDPVDLIPIVEQLNVPWILSSNGYLDVCKHLEMLVRDGRFHIDPRLFCLESMNRPHADTVSVICPVAHVETVAILLDQFGFSCGGPPDRFVEHPNAPGGCTMIDRVGDPIEIKGRMYQVLSGWSD